MLTAEELLNDHLKAVLDFLLVCHSDIAADSRSRNQDDKSHFEHHFVVEEEAHVR